MEGFVLTLSSVMKHAQHARTVFSLVENVHMIALQLLLRVALRA